MIPEQMEEALELTVRPYLRQHGGDIRIESFEDGVLTVKFVGSCAECPSMRNTLEEIVSRELQSRFREIHSVRLNDGVSGELLAFARQLLGISGKDR